MNKDEIRRQVRARKTMLDDAEKLSAAARVFDTVRNLAAYTLAKNVLMYHSLADELSTREFLAEYYGDKKFFLPRVNGLDLEILPYDRTHMHLGSFRIEEPDGDATESIDNIDLVVVPAVAFDRRGNRIGRGKGYYDRLLSRSRAITIGVCYDFQLFDEFETEEHDIPVDFVVTERRIVTRNKNR